MHGPLLVRFRPRGQEYALTCPLRPDWPMPPASMPASTAHSFADGGGYSVRRGRATPRPAASAHYRRITCRAPCARAAADNRGSALYVRISIYPGGSVLHKDAVICAALFGTLRAIQAVLAGN